MKFLLTIKDKTSNSKDVLDIGCKIAEGFSADLTICYVGKKSKAIMDNDVKLARKSLSDWNIYHPGLEVLEWAFNLLKTKGFALNLEFNVDNLKEVNDQVRMVIPTNSNYKIRLILREGELLSELKSEVSNGDYDITILRAPKKKRMIHSLAQFINSSILFVKNFNLDFNYKILLCVDDSRATKRAVILSTRIAKQFSADITNITITKTTFLGKNYRDAHNWANRYLDRKGVNYISNMNKGNPVDEFIKQAGQDHIIILGKSKSNEIIKFIWGSKPIYTVQQSDCPVLLVN